MYYPFVMRAEAVVWLVWIVTWHIAGIWRGKATVEAPTSTYRRYFVIIAIGLILIFSAIPKLSWPLLWVTPPALGWTMIGVTVAGIAFAWWARITMGKLWSGGIEVKDGHRVVETGPFALARHPIYTGLITAAIAAAVIRATPWALAGAALFALGFILKAKVEERFLEAELGGYDAYRKRVRMIVPLPKSP
ncbi:MAG TPA: isoprenylcysteine carboxylmethyltransferase family protein [Sphingomonadaceae bacterium]